MKDNKTERHYVPETVSFGEDYLQLSINAVQLSESTPNE